MNKRFTTAKQLFEQNDLTTSLLILNEIISGENIDIQWFILRARILFKLQKWGEAMNDFASVLEIDPENQDARTGIEMTRNILGYFNPDLFNP